MRRSLKLKPCSEPRSDHPLVCHHPDLSQGADAPPGSAVRPQNRELGALRIRAYSRRMRTRISTLGYPGSVILLKDRFIWCLVEGRKEKRWQKLKHPSRVG